VLAAVPRPAEKDLLDLWILPRIGRLRLTLVGGQVQGVLNAMRTSAPGRRQDAGSCMRGLVTYARQLHWLTQHNEDPMFGVSYSAKAKYQGQAVHYVPRSSLPTDEECEKLFVHLEAMGRRRVATTMRLAYRAAPASASGRCCARAM
jgi:hypothetical protein